MLNQSFHPCNELGSKPSVHACSQTFVSGGTGSYLRSTAVNFNHVCTCYMLLHGCLLRISIGRAIWRCSHENPTWLTCFIVIIKASFYLLSHSFDLSLSLHVCLQVFQLQLQQCLWVSPEREVTARPASESILHLTQVISTFGLHHHQFSPVICVWMSTIRCPAACIILIVSLCFWKQSIFPFSLKVLTYHLFHEMFFHTILFYNLPEMIIDLFSGGTAISS